MNKLIAMLIFVILVSGCASPNSQSYSTYQTNYNLADEGSGPVEIRPECVQQINEYKFLGYKIDQMVDCLFLVPNSSINFM